MNLRVRLNVGNFLISWETISFSGRTLLHGVSWNHNLLICLVNLALYHLQKFIV